MDACDFIFKHKVEKGIIVTYARTVCTVRPEKEEQNQTRITIRGNLLDYPGEKYTDTTGLELIKMHWQSVLSTRGAKYMTIANPYIDLSTLRDMIRDCLVFSLTAKGLKFWQKRCELQFGHEEVAEYKTNNAKFTTPHKINDKINQLHLEHLYTTKKGIISLFDFEHLIHTLSSIAPVLSIQV